MEQREGTYSACIIRPVMCQAKLNMMKYDQELRLILFCETKRNETKPSEI